MLEKFTSINILNLFRLLLDVSVVVWMWYLLFGGDYVVSSLLPNEVILVGAVLAVVLNYSLGFYLPEKKNLFIWKICFGVYRFLLPGVYLLKQITCFIKGDLFYFDTFWLKVYPSNFTWDTFSLIVKEKYKIEPNTDLITSFQQLVIDSGMCLSYADLLPMFWDYYSKTWVVVSTVGEVKDLLLDIEKDHFIKKGTFLWDTLSLSKESTTDTSLLKWFILTFFLGLGLFFFLKGFPGSSSASSEAASPLPASGLGKDSFSDFKSQVSQNCPPSLEGLKKTYESDNVINRKVLALVSQALDTIGVHQLPEVLKKITLIIGAGSAVMSQMQDVSSNSEQLGVELVTLSLSNNSILESQSELKDCMVGIKNQLTSLEEHSDSTKWKYLTLKLVLALISSGIFNVYDSSNLQQFESLRELVKTASLLIQDDRDGKIVLTATQYTSLFNLVQEYTAARLVEDSQKINIV